MKKILIAVVLLLLLSATVESRRLVSTVEHRKDIEGLFVENIKFPTIVAANTSFEISYDVRNEYSTPTYLCCAILRIGWYQPVVDFWYGYMNESQVIHRDYTCSGIAETTEFHIQVQHWNGEWYIDHIERWLIVEVID